jgi:hypothetical protein
VVVSNAYGVARSAEAALRLFTPGIDLYDDFEPGIDLTQWAGFGGEVAANGNGGSISGVNALWFGGDGMRFALSRRLDTRRGGFIRFFLRLADGPGYPWEAPELPDEGMVLECSSDGGSAWTELARCDSIEFRAWRGVQVALPPAARSAATQFRWRQLTHSGTGFDHWAIDGVWVNANSIPPRLRITQTASEVVLSWPEDWSGYLVQEAGTLGAPVPWTTLDPQPPVEVVAGQNVVRLPLRPASRFYQLIHP